MPWGTRALRHCQHSGRRGVRAELRSESPPSAAEARVVSPRAEALATTGLGEPMRARYERVVPPARPASLDPLRGRRGAWVGASVLALCLAAGCGRKNNPEFQDEVAYFYEDHAWLHKAWAANQAGAAHLSQGAWAAAADHYARARQLGAEKFAELDGAIKERDPLLASELGLFGQRQRAADVLVSNALLQGYVWVAAMDWCCDANYGGQSGCVHILAARAAWAFTVTEPVVDTQALSQAGEEQALEFLRYYYEDLAEYTSGSYNARRDTRLADGWQIYHYCPV